MSQIIKPVALDESVQETNQILENLNTDVTGALETFTTEQGSIMSGFSTDMNATLSGFSTDMNATLSGFSTDMNTTLDNFAAAQEETLGSMADALVGVLASVKSINGKHGVVVLDGGDILISKNTQNSKTISQMLSEMNGSIAKTPLSFSTTKIPNTNADYILNIAIGTPS